MASVANMLDGIWFDRPKVEDAEYAYHVYMAKGVKQSVKGVKKEAGGVAEQIAQAREKIHRTLQESDNSLSSEAAANLKKLESDNVELRRIVNTLVEKMTNMEARISKLETGGQKTTSTPAQPVQHHKPVENDDDDDDDDEDIDLFGSDDEEDEETARIRQERLDAYHAKKSKKPAVTAKSTIVLDIKPWDDQTDMAELERSVRSVQTDGLVWGASKLVDVAFGIKKLQIGCVVEDDKVGTDFLEDNITGFDDLVQSMDIVAFNKI